MAEVDIGYAQIRELCGAHLWLKNTFEWRQQTRRCDCLFLSVDDKIPDVNETCEKRVVVAGDSERVALRLEHSVHRRCESDACENATRRRKNRDKLIVMLRDVRETAAESKLAVRPGLFES